MILIFHFLRKLSKLSVKTTYQGEIEMCRYIKDFCKLSQYYSNTWTGELMPVEKSSLLPVFIHQVLLDYSHTHSLCIVCGCFHATQTKLDSCSRDQVDCKATIFCYVVPYKNFADSVYIQSDMSIFKNCIMSERLLHTSYLTM